MEASRPGADFVPPLYQGLHREKAGPGVVPAGLITVPDRVPDMLNKERGRELDRPATETMEEKVN